MSSYEVYVLENGYSRNGGDGKMQANCTCTLIKGPKNMIVDTMTAWDGKLILDGLEKHDVKPEDISYVVCTHGHSDHIGNNNLFLNAVHIVGFDISFKNIYLNHNLSSGQSYGLDVNGYVTLVPTRGHTLADVTVVVHTRDNGIVAITGDLFEHENDIEDESMWLEAGSMDPNSQRKCRKLIISFADWIVPGHGPMFKVSEEMRGLISTNLDPT